MTKENRGGKREGAGRPKKPAKEYSEKFKKDLRRALNRKKKETGLSEHDLLVDLIYDPATQDSVRLGAYKQIMEAFVVKEIKQTNIGESLKNLVIMLPPTMNQPKKVIESTSVIEAKTKEDTESAGNSVETSSGTTD